MFHYYAKEDYLAALAKVPIYTPEKLDRIMRYYIELAKMLADLGMARLCQIEQQAQELQRGDEQICKISDSAKGIPKDLLDKIGTPFITTRTGGTGLGLAVCFSIAARHNAQIIIESNSAGQDFCKVSRG